EDGIRDFHVTGVQTCALPILTEQRLGEVEIRRLRAGLRRQDQVRPAALQRAAGPCRKRLAAEHEAGEKLLAGAVARAVVNLLNRSEERRVGKEGVSSMSL